MNQEEQKEKYSAFISDVSEILGLGKPIDILKLCMVTDRFFKPLQNQVKELEAQIEKMKCCENCNHKNLNWSFSPICKARDEIEIENPLFYKCDKWEIKE